VRVGQRTASAPETSVGFVFSVVFLCQTEEGLERRGLDLQERFDAAEEEAHELEQVGEPLGFTFQVRIASGPHRLMSGRCAAPGQPRR
jgi:hypothetical protein